MSEKILIGKIVNVFGLSGEVKVYNYSGAEDRYEKLEQIFAGGNRYRIQQVRHQKNMILLKLEGVDDRDAAERLRGKNVYMSEEELPELPENEHYIRDMIGMEVYDEPTGRIVGTLKDVLTERAQPVYVVNTEDGGEVLIPGVPVFVKKIDETTRRITVALIEGMLP